MVKILSLSLIIALALCHGCAQGAPPTAAAPPPSAQEFLEAHNQARAEVGVAALNWSPTLATAASLEVRYQRDKKNCSIADTSSGKYGGNQMWAGGMAVPPRMAVENWVEEKSFYDYANNSCVSDHMCGSYTQVIWKKSLELGCAQATCTKDKVTLTICFYNPPGNIIGERPY